MSTDFGALLTEHTYQGLQRVAQLYGEGLEAALTRVLKYGAKLYHHHLLGGTFRFINAMGDVENIRFFNEEQDERWLPPTLFTLEPLIKARTFLDGELREFFAYYEAMWSITDEEILGGFFEFGRVAAEYAHRGFICYPINSEGHGVGPVDLRKAQS